MPASNLRRGIGRAVLPALILALLLGPAAIVPAEDQQWQPPPGWCSCIGEVSGSRALVEAVCFGTEQQVISLICGGADVNSRITSIQCPDDCERPPLRTGISVFQIAGARGDQKILKTLMDAGANKGASIRIGSKHITAAGFAKMYKHKEMAKSIEKYSPGGKSLIDCSKYQRVPKFSAFKGPKHPGFPKGCKKPQEPGSNPKADEIIKDLVNTKGCPLDDMAQAICDGGNPDVVAYHLPSGDVPALSKATWNCCANQVTTLLGENEYNTKPANVNYQDNEGHSALWWTARSCKAGKGWNDCVETAKALLKHGADPNVAVDGETVLMRAVKMGCSRAFINALIQAGADPNIKDKDGNTVWKYADPETKKVLHQHSGRKK